LRGLAFLKWSLSLLRFHSLHPAVTLITLGAVGALAPQHGEAQGPLGPVIRRLYTGLIQENPQAVDLPQYLAGQPAGVILCGLKEQKQQHQTRIKPAPLDYSRRPIGKPAQLLQELFQLDSEALATIIGSLRKPTGFADQMR